MTLGRAAGGAVVVRRTAERHRRRRRRGADDAGAQARPNERKMKKGLRINPFLDYQDKNISAVITGGLSDSSISSIILRNKSF